MLMLRSKQGQIRCKKGQSIRTTKTVAFQVTDCTNGGAPPAVCCRRHGCPPHSDSQPWPVRAPETSEAPGRLVDGAHRHRMPNGSVRLDVQAVTAKRRRRRAPLIFHHFRNPKGINTMTSFIRIVDIPPDELHLLPIIGLRQQIREDRNRLSPPNSRTDQGERDGSRPGRALHGRPRPQKCGRRPEEGLSPTGNCKTNHAQAHTSPLTGRTSTTRTLTTRRTKMTARRTTGDSRAAG